MDNKYGLGSSKVATEQHDIRLKTDAEHVKHCKFCSSVDLVLSPTLHDHRCAQCGEMQNDVPQGYSTGRSSDY